MGLPLDMDLGEVVDPVMGGVEFLGSVRKERGQDGGSGGATGDGT